MIRACGDQKKWKRIRGYENGQQEVRRLGELRVGERLAPALSAA
jgi:hypothetical protein